MLTFAAYVREDKHCLIPFALVFWFWREQINKLTTYQTFYIYLNPNLNRPAVRVTVAKLRLDNCCSGEGFSKRLIWL